MKIYETRSAPETQETRSSRALGKIKQVIRLLPIIAVSIACISTASAAIADDSYVAGYATGILKYEFKIDTPSLTVQNGNITCPPTRYQR